MEDGEITVSISTKKKALKKIETELDQHDSIRIANLSKEKRDRTMQVGDLTGQLGEIRIMMDERLDEKKRLEDRLPDAEEGSKVKELETKSQVFKWLSNVFKSAMDDYKETARKSVEKISTDAWMSITPEPGKYKELRLDENWNVVVMGSNGRPLSIGNPGHRQTLAVCIFDGLRRTSDLQFPTFFDNPGSNISSEVMEKMAEYFWADNSGQMVMLSHSGGLEEEESIQRYGKRLAGAWRITYSEGEHAISEIERVV